MASPTLTSNYSGDVLDYIVTETVTENEAFKKGSLYMIPGVSKNINIAKMTSSANPIGAREAMPTTKTATVTWSESIITPVDMQIYIDDINPRIFESAWREFQPKGALPDKVLDPNIQKVFADVVLRQAQNQMGRLIWQGDTSLGGVDPMRFFNGFVTQAAASGTNIDATNAGVLSAATIIAALESVNNSIPDALYEDPDMVFHMSTASYRMYQQANRALTYKGSGPDDKAAAVYGGREIRHYAGFPANRIIAARATKGTDSAFYCAVDKESDMENLVIGKLRPEGEHYFLLAKFKAAVGYPLDSETVYYVGS